MATRDLFNRVKQVQALAFAVISTDTLSSAIDMTGFQSLIATVTIGAAGITLSPTNKIELELLECDTVGGSYTQVAAADLQGAVTGTNTGCFAVLDDSAKAASIVKVGYLGNKGFLKVNVNFSGTHGTGTGVGVVASKSHAADLPVV